MYLIYTLLVIVICLAMVFIAITQLKSTRGWWGEWTVHCILKFLPKEYYVYNDVRVYVNGRKCQIDHLVISPYGIFVVETKSYLGVTSGSSNDKKLTRMVLGKRYLIGNPLIQNQYHLDMLSLKLQNVPGFNDQWLKSVIVFCFGSRFKLFDKPDNVIMFYSLYPYIRKYKNEIISDTSLKEITRKLF